MYWRSGFLGTVGESKGQVRSRGAIGCNICRGTDVIKPVEGVVSPLQLYVRFTVNVKLPSPGTCTLTFCRTGHAPFSKKYLFFFFSLFSFSFLFSFLFSLFSFFSSLFFSFFLFFSLFFLPTICSARHCLPLPYFSAHVAPAKSSTALLLALLGGGKFAAGRTSVMWGITVFTC